MQELRAIKGLRASRPTVWGFLPGQDYDYSAGGIAAADLESPIAVADFYFGGYIMNSNTFTGSCVDYITQGIPVLKWISTYGAAPWITYLQEPYRILFRDLLNSVIANHERGYSLPAFDISWVSLRRGVAFITSPGGSELLEATPEGMASDFVNLRNLIGEICYYSLGHNLAFTPLPYDLEHFMFVLCYPGIDINLLKRHTAILNLSTRIRFLEALNDQRRFFLTVDQDMLDVSISMYASHMTRHGLNLVDWRTMVGQVPELNNVRIGINATADLKHSFLHVRNVIHHMVDKSRHPLPTHFVSFQRVDEILTGLFPYMSHMTQWFLHLNGILPLFCLNDRDVQQY